MKKKGASSANRKLKRPPFNEVWWVASMRQCQAAGVRWPTAEPESLQEVALVTTHQLFVGVRRGSVHMETLIKNLSRASAIIGSTQTIPPTVKETRKRYSFGARCSRAHVPPVGLIRRHRFSVRMEVGVETQGFALNPRTTLCVLPSGQEVAAQRGALNHENRFTFQRSRRDAPTLSQ